MSRLAKRVRLGVLTAVYPRMPMCWGCDAGKVIHDRTYVYGPPGPWRLTALRSFETSEAIHPTTQRLVPKDRNHQRDISDKFRPLGIYHSATQSFLQHSGLSLRWHRAVFRRSTLPTSSGCKTGAAPSSATSLPTYQTIRCYNLNGHNVNSPHLIKHHAMTMTTCGGVEVQLPAFWSSVLHGYKWWASRLGRFSS